MTTFKTLQKVLPKLYSMLPYYLGWKYALPPAHAFFEVTYRCNLRCDMCHYLEIIEDTETNRKFKDELSAERVKQAIDSLPRFSLITFTGGEAFMKSDFREILTYAAKRHKVHIITNGTLLNEELVEFLIDHRVKNWWSPGVFYLGVSLEGHEQLHDEITQVEGSFQKTTAGLERLLKKRGTEKFPLIHLTTVIGNNNVKELADLYDYANDLGVNVMNFVLHNPAEYNHYKNYDHEAALRAPSAQVEEIDPNLLRTVLDDLDDKSQTHGTQLRFSPNYITKEEIVRYYSNKSSYKNYRCYIPWTKVAVSAYGDAFSCPHFRLGNIEDTGGSIPWHADRTQKFRQMVKEEKIFPGCLGCCQSEYVGPQNGAADI